MGVKGLWKILESTGKSVTLEDLSGKIVAIDVSVWLHQLSKGLRNSKGEPLPNGHLLGVFRRLCKLLFYGIKPVFVFDGKVSALKINTIMKRQKKRQEAEKAAIRLRKEVVHKLLQKQAFKLVFGDAKEVNKEKRKNTKNSLVKYKSDSDEDTKKDIIKNDPFFLPPTTTLDYDDEEEEFDDDIDDIYCSIKNQELINRFLRGNNDEVDNVIDDNNDSVNNISMENDDDNSDISVSSTNHTNEISEKCKEDEKEDIVSNFKNYDFYHFNDSDIGSDNGRKLDKMPEDSEAFSNFQLGRLLSGNLRKRKSFEGMNDDSGMGWNKSTTKTSSNAGGDDILVEGCSYEGGGDDKYHLIDSKMFSNSTMRYVLAKRKCDNEKTFINNLNFDSKNDDSTQKRVQFNDTKKDSTNEYAAIDTNPMSNNLYKDKDNDITRWRKRIILNWSRPLTDETYFSRIENKMDDKFVDKNVKILPENLNFDELFAKKKNERIEIENEGDDNDEDEDDDDFIVVSDNITSTTQLEKLRDARCISNFSLLNNKTIDVSPKDIALIEPCVSTINITNIKTTFLDNDFLNFKNVDENTNTQTITTTNPPITTTTTEVENIMSIQNLASTKMVVSTTTLPTMPITITTNSSTIKKDDVQDEVDEDNINDNEDSDDTVADNKTKEDEDERIKEIVKEILEPLTSNSESLDTRETKLRKVGERLDVCLDRAREEKGTEERKGVSITEKMCVEVQHLLKLFEVPFIKAPEEAESECARLNYTHQVDAVLTDDSDAFLFGALKVIRGLFSGNDGPKIYSMDSIQRKVGLSRGMLVCIGMMSGCDYHHGVDRVGPSTAIKILKEFKSENKNENEDKSGENNETGVDNKSEEEFQRLVKFRKWWNVAANYPEKSKSESPFKHSLKKLKLPNDFPSRAVFDAFMNAVVDKCTGKLTWGSPVIDSLNKYAQKVLQWNEKKTREMLFPLEKSFKIKKKTL